MEAEDATNDGHRMANDPDDQHSQGEGEAREDGARDYNRERSPFQSERFIISFLNDNLEGCLEDKIGAARDSETLQSQGLYVQSSQGKSRQEESGSRSILKTGETRNILYKQVRDIKMTLTSHGEATIPMINAKVRGVFRGVKETLML